MERTITDNSGNKIYQVHSQSDTHTLIDGFNDARVASSYAESMLGSYNNAGSSGQSEQYTGAMLLHMVPDPETGERIGWVDGVIELKDGEKRWLEI